MNTILLAAINARYTHSCLALYCLKSYAADAGRTIVVREYSINRDPREILADMAAVRPDIIGLSVYIWNSGLIRRMLPLLKDRCGNRLLILGGPEVSYNPESWIAEFPDIDCIIAGPGEAGFLSFLERGKACGETIVRAPNPPFGEMPFPYLDGDISAMADRYVYYESSRGCPFRCSYCLSSRADQKFESKGIETVKRELGLILQHRPKLVKFVDRTFNMPGGRHLGIWSFLIDRFGSGPTVYHFEIHPSNLGKEDFAILDRAPAGLFQFEAGVQSTNQEVRTASGRSGTWETEKAALARLIGMGTIPVHLDLIAGLPFEDMASVKISFNEVYGLSPGHFQLGTLKVLPGTEMRNRADEYGMVYAAGAPYQVRETRWLSGDDMRLIEKIAALVDHLYNTGRFSLTLACLAARFDSPFDLYSAFVSGSTLPTKSWESGASFLISFAAGSFPDDRDYYLDALRWDWCAQSRSHLLPVLVKPSDSADNKKKGYAFFKGISENGRVRYRGAEFALSDLKKSIFFRSESDQFRSEKMNGCACALFLPDKRTILFN